MADTSGNFPETTMDDIYNGRGPWCFETSPVNVSRNHAVLYQLPASLKAPPEPHINSQVRHLNREYLIMPFSSSNLFPVTEENGEVFKERWNVIETALLQPIQSSRELEAVMISYNSRLMKCLALHHFFEEVVEEEEAASFFYNLLPKIIGLALRLPQILPGNLPLLNKNYERAISLSQLQIASLLANAFLCTFQRRSKDSEAIYPGINFDRLFASHLHPKRENSVAEKLKCICHYFRRVTEHEPIGVVTFERKYIPESQIPDWNRIEKRFAETRLLVSSRGLIEDDALGLLQLDFANKNVGGGVLGFGCVQEEIRYVICPELIVSRLFTEQLGPTEALIIIGAERYSQYSGYGDSFTWEGDYKDATPHDVWGRKRTSIVAIDALRFNRPMEQYTVAAMVRELNKAYVGFHSNMPHRLPAIATGNWGCGAFNGNPRLKGLLQLMACSATRRDMVYYTFEDEDLRDDLYNMYKFLVSQQIQVSQLWRYLFKFTQLKNIQPKHLYEYIRQIHLNTIGKPSLKTYFRNINLKQNDNNEPSTSAPSTSENKCHTTTAETNTSDNIRKRKITDYFSSIGKT